MNTHFIGRIGKDAEVVDGKNGKFLSMDIATDYYSRGENRTMWVRVRTNIPRYVEKLAPHLKKGKMITVEGEQQEPRCWTGKDGQPHAQIVLVANYIDFVHIGKRKEQEQQAENTAPVDNKDDLPF